MMQDTTKLAADFLNAFELLALKDGSLATQLLADMNEVNHSLHRTVADVRKEHNLSGRNYTALLIAAKAGTLKQSLATNVDFNLTPAELEYFAHPMRTAYDFNHTLFFPWHERGYAYGGYNASGYNVVGFDVAGQPAREYSEHLNRRIEEHYDDDPSTLIVTVLAHLGSGAGVMGAAVNAELSRIAEAIQGD